MDEHGESVVIALINQRLSAWEVKVDKVVDDHERRLRAVEKWMYAIPVSVLVALVSLVATIMDRSGG